MKRLLIYPAATSAVLFLTLTYSIAGQNERRAFKRSSAANQQPPVNRTIKFDRASPHLIAESEKAATGNRLSRTAAQELVKIELLRPWSRASVPRHRLFSRAAPRLPSTDVQLQVVEQMAYFLGSATMSEKGQSEQVALIVDRASRQLFVFADGSWQDHREWLEKLKATQTDEVNSRYAMQLTELDPTGR